MTILENTVDLKGYRMGYEIDIYNFTNSCGWVVLAKLKTIEYAGKFGRNNIKVCLKDSRMWQIHIKEDVYLEKMNPTGD